MEKRSNFKKKQLIPKVVPRTNARPAYGRQAGYFLFYYYAYIKNFIAKSDKHRQILIDNFQPADNEVLRMWLKDKCAPLPEIRVRIMNFIWNHNCYCQCS